MKKSEAIKIANSLYGIDCDQTNSHFSKVNATKPVWWIEVSLKKIQQLKVPFLYFLLQKNTTVRVLKIPILFLRASINDFRIRNDKHVMCFEINISTYQDVIGPNKIDLKRFLLADQDFHPAPTLVLHLDKTTS